MRDADFVQINGIVFETEYLRVPDESTVADDVVLELKRGETEVAFTREELDDAEYVGDGALPAEVRRAASLPVAATLH